MNILKDEQLELHYNVHSFKLNGLRSVARAQHRETLKMVGEYRCGIKDDLAYGWIMISPEDFKALNQSGEE